MNLAKINFDYWGVMVRPYENKRRNVDCSQPTKCTWNLIKTSNQKITVTLYEGNPEDLQVDDWKCRYNVTILLVVTSFLNAFSPEVISAPSVDTHLAFWNTRAWYISRKSPTIIVVTSSNNPHIAYQHLEPPFVLALLPSHIVFITT